MEQPAAGENLWLPIAFARIFHHFQVIFPSKKHPRTEQRSAAQKSNFLEIPGNETKLAKSGYFSKCGYFFSRIYKISSSVMRNKESISPGLSTGTKHALCHDSASVFFLHKICKIFTYLILAEEKFYIFLSEDEQICKKSEYVSG